MLQVGSLIFVAEWGDRSMLATIALGAAQSPAGKSKLNGSHIQTCVTVLPYSAVVLLLTFMLFAHMDSHAWYSEVLSPAVLAIANLRQCCTFTHDYVGRTASMHLYMQWYLW